MTHQQDNGKPQDAAPETSSERRRTLDEIFGDVLPETTSDERDHTDRDDKEDWYRSNRPPHHGT